MIKEIVIPLDGSAEAEITLPYGLALSQKLGAQLDFVAVDESGAADTANLYKSYLSVSRGNIPGGAPGRPVSRQAKPPMRFSASSKSTWQTWSSCPLTAPPAAARYWWAR